MEDAEHGGGAPTLAGPSPVATWARVLAVAAVMGVYYLIQWMTRELAIYPHLELSPEIVSSARAFDHHTWQMLLAVIAIGILGRGGWREWGFNLDHLEESLRIIRRFSYYYVVYFVGIGFVLQWVLKISVRLEEAPTATQVWGKLLFGFLFVGLSEEILFRGLIHTFLARFWRGVWKKGQRWEFPTAGLIASLIFTVAHIGFSFDPFRVTHLVPLQLVQAFVLGIFYSWAYHRTGSLLAPIVAHNISDGALWASEYILYWIRN